MLVGSHITDAAETSVHYGIVYTDGDHGGVRTELVKAASSLP